jgi:hypothetical protein
MSYELHVFTLYEEMQDEFPRLCLVKEQSRGDNRYRGCSDVAPTESSAAICIVNLRSQPLYEA